MKNLYIQYDSIELTSTDYFWYINDTSKINTFLKTDLCNFLNNCIDIGIGTDRIPLAFKHIPEYVSNEIQKNDRIQADNISLTDLYITADSNIPLIMRNKLGDLTYFASAEYNINQCCIFNINNMQIATYLENLGKTISIYPWNINPNNLASEQPFSKFGLKYKNAINDSNYHAWYANSAYAFHNLIKLALDKIQQYLIQPNGAAVYYISPFNNNFEEGKRNDKQLITFVMGILSDNFTEWNKDSEIYYRGIKNTDEETLLKNTNQYFGIADTKHVHLRKTIGFAWPLLSGNINRIETSNINFDSQSSKEILYGLSGGVLNTRTLDISLDKNINNMLLNTDKLDSATPKIWNIPYVRTANENTNILFMIDDTIIENIWSNIKYPSAIIEFYHLNKNVQNSYKQQFLNLERVWLKFIDKFNKNLNLSIFKFPNLKMIVTNEIDLSNLSNYGFGIVDTNDLINKKVKWDKNTFPNASNIKYVTEFLTNNITKNIIIATKNLNMLSATSDYLNLKKDVGSGIYEYPSCLSRTGKLTNDNKFLLTSTYTFKNLLDFVLFYYHYKHVINHYFCKLNILLKTNVFNNLHNYSNLTEILSNPIDYARGTTYANLISLNNIICDFNCLFKTFPNDSNIPNTISACCSPYGNFDWKDIDNHSYLNTYTVSEIPSKLFLSDDKQLIIKNMKKLLSIYRPFYIEYKNMFISQPISTSKINEDGFTCGYFIGNNKKIIINNINITLNTYCILNSAALNADYGWGEFEVGKSAYTIDSILNADISINGLK